VENYFNYFTEIEEHYLQRRGGGLLLSTLDWALIESWKDAGIPLAAVLRGIDKAFDHYDQRPSKTRKVNSLAYCSQEVLAAVEDMKEAALGAGRVEPAPFKSSQGFETEAIASFLRRNADLLQAAGLAQAGAVAAKVVATDAGNAVRRLADEIKQNSSPRLEDLERRLTVLEEKIMAALLASTPDDEIVAVRSEADRDLAPYRHKMSAAQIDQLHRQYVQKRLLEKYRVPRLSLFYM
jgi:hypothetical protein